jgi:hypothetical protein
MQYLLFCRQEVDFLGVSAVKWAVPIAQTPALRHNIGLSVHS